MTMVIFSVKVQKTIILQLLIKITFVTLMVTISTFL